MLAGGLEADLLGQLLDARGVVGRDARVLGEQLVVRLPGKRRREVDRRVAPGQLAAPGRWRRIASTISFSVRSIIVR